MERLPFAVAHILSDRGWARTEVGVFVAADSFEMEQRAAARLLEAPETAGIGIITYLNHPKRWKKMYHNAFSSGKERDALLQQHIMVAEWEALGRMDAHLMTGSGFASTAAAGGGVADIRYLEVNATRARREPTPLTVCPGNHARQKRLPKTVD